MTRAWTLVVLLYALVCTVGAAVVARVGADLLVGGLPFSRDAIVGTLVVVQLLAASWYGEAACKRIARWSRSGRTPTDGQGPAQ